ncbi:hypothetical protein [Rufibacter ruber]|uniref:hypothetical protein n=1 Tax=Rufibacter ruber TaxID=1783499 RepID=UPI0008305F8A|nr:hypothetical protein [Rufibacter ruber]
MTFYYSKYQKIGQFTCLAVFILGMIYAATTLLGFLSLKSPAEPIGNPYFTIMEVLTILIAPLMAISMVAVHAYASPVDKIYSLAALLFMCLMTGITSSVHFIMLTGSQQAQVAQHADFRFFFSFKWISVAYALDILAWDWFFALSFLLASFVFKSSREEKLLQKVMMISSILSLAGLMGVPLNNMQIRNIGILGYAGIAPFAFLWIGKILGQPKAPVS